MIEPLRIVDQRELKLYGRSMETSYARYQPGPLWRSLRTDLAAAGANDQPAFYSLQVYPREYSRANPHAPFTYWAAIGRQIEGVAMDELIMPPGKYAVFLHKGTAPSFQNTARAIHGDWMPRSGYTVDHRPHFEVLGEKYLGPLDPASEEEVFIPITPLK